MKEASWSLFGVKTFAINFKRGATAYLYWRAILHTALESVLHTALESVLHTARLWWRRWWCGCCCVSRSTRIEVTCLNFAAWSCTRVCEKYLSLSKTCEPEKSEGGFQGGKAKITTIVSDLSTRFNESETFKNFYTFILNLFSLRVTNYFNCV